MLSCPSHCIIIDTVIYLNDRQQQHEQLSASYVAIEYLYSSSTVPALSTAKLLTIHGTVTYRIVSYSNSNINCERMSLSIVHRHIQRRIHSNIYTYFSQYNCCQMHVTSFILYHCYYCGCCWGCHYFLSTPTQIIFIFLEYLKYIEEIFSLPCTDHQNNIFCAVNSTLILLFLVHFSACMTFFLSLPSL